MPKAKLDHVFCLIATCKAGKKRTDYWDTVISGFLLECHASGAKTYTFRYQDQYGRQCQRKIGGHADITFAQAQKLAKKFRAEVVMGGDPAARKAEKKATPTYEELADQHLSFAKTYQKRPGNTDAILRVHILPKWGKKQPVPTSGSDRGRSV